MPEHAHRWILSDPREGIVTGLCQGGAQRIFKATLTEDWMRLPVNPTYVGEPERGMLAEEALR